MPDDLPQIGHDADRQNRVAGDHPEVATGIDPQQQSIASAANLVSNALAKTPARRLVRAALADFKFIDGLQHKFGKSLGFLPRQAIEVNLEAGNVCLTTENDDSAGYMLVRPRLAWQPLMASIVQAAVCMDAQRRHHGLGLLLLLEDEARSRGQIALQANCAIGVEANEFWSLAGFKPVAHLTPATKSQREIVCWRKPLQRKLPNWFTVLPKKAGGRGHAVNSTRNLNRTDSSAAFAARFTAGRNFTAGDPTAPTSGLVKSLAELEQRMAELEGEC